MGRIFQGLVKCGAWGCFDEFNRLEQDVLSAVSQQIQIIQAAIKENRETMDFMGKSIEVDASAGIFVTMNPAGKGYGGRSKLPDNLKQLFRSVAMTVPDNQLIAEVLLLSEGFQNAKEIGRKMVSLFTTSSQLLTPQHHYDWGLRALKTALSIAGKFMREAEDGDGAGEQREKERVLQAVRVTALPKLTRDDSQRFTELMQDIFPDVNTSDAVSEELLTAIREEIAQRGLEEVEGQVQKILQLHMACTQRTGVIVVGPCGSGKTTLWRVLEGAYKRLQRGVSLHVMNPKAMPRHQLLGHMDADTREWYDGVLTAAARAVIREPPDQHSWIICDGDIDPEWIESLNSVLDDNRLLTLPNGERIQFGNNANFLFECDHLTYASPATISRTGVIFLSEDDVDANLMISSWLQQHFDSNDNRRSTVESVLQSQFSHCLSWVVRRGTKVATTKLGIVKNALSQLREASTRTQAYSGLARGFCALLDGESANDFAQEISKRTGEGDLLAPAQDGVNASEEEFPTSIVLIDHMRRYKSVIMGWLRGQEHFIISGPEGCGKTKLLEHCFAELANTDVATMSCSAQTTSMNVIQKLTQVCGNAVSARGGKCIRPRDSEFLVLHLKDVNLPKPDKYDTMELISFLQQVVTYGGFHDDHLEFVQIQNIILVGSMNPPDGLGRNKLSARFTSSVRILHMEYPPEGQFKEIYEKMITRVFRESGAKAQSSESIASAMLELWNLVSRDFRMDKKRHYRFTPRNISEWAQSLQRYDLETTGLENALAYEASRVFRDKLVDNESREHFDSLLASALTSHFRKGASLHETMFTSLAVPRNEREETPVGTKLTKVSMDRLEEVISEGLTSYEREVKELGILLFNDVLERAAKIDRVLTRYVART